VNESSLKEATLVVLGHGTVENENSAAALRQQVAELRCRNVFADVREAFWKQEPRIKRVLEGIATARVYIVPFFISEGYFASEVIPKELGFGESSRFNPPSLRYGATGIQDSTFIYCKPVGTHEGMTGVILARAEEVMKRFPFPRAPKAAETTLFIAGHGTEKNENSRKPVERQAELIRAKNIYADVRAIYLEEAPRIAECFLLAKTRNMVIIPFFISDGLHTQEDVPLLLGETKKNVEQRLAAGQPTWRNPTEKNGKLVWYATAVGSAPELAEVILERAREASENL
jgi:sirohydrochlorin cobaltochelatase